MIYRLLVSCFPNAIPHHQSNTDRYFSRHSDQSTASIIIMAEAMAAAQQLNISSSRRFDLIEVL